MKPGQELATTIISDMKYMEPTAWAYWEGVEEKAEDIVRLGDETSVGISRKAILTDRTIMSSADGFNHSDGQ